LFVLKFPDLSLETRVEDRMSDIEVERKGEVEWIRLNRPDRMNAYDAEMAGELIDAVENASDAGVIVLTGTGRAFCAGGYLANLSDPDPEALRSMFYGSLKVYESLRTSPRPVIAAVNGAARRKSHLWTNRSEGRQRTGAGRNQFPEHECW
jgi:enoyl-CoA hydratase/carnithine racemase